VSDSTKPAKMRLSSGYQIECPCGATIDSFTCDVCCLNCRREFTMQLPKNAPAPATLQNFGRITVQQRYMWDKLL
jgi:hypothetical protein